jgi:hypothetical protein
MRGALRILVPCLLLAACASMMNQRTLGDLQFEEQWMGHPEAQIITTLGPPTRETTDGKGGHILVWEFERSGPRFCLGGCPPGTPPSRWLAVRHAYIGPDGLIYRTYWQSP